MKKLLLGYISNCLIIYAFLGVAACSISEVTSSETGSESKKEKENNPLPEEQQPGETSTKIAPDCTKELTWCAQGSVTSKLACTNVDGLPFDITTQFEGKSLQVACGVEDDTGVLDLTISPPEGDTKADGFELRFRLPNYKGGGTYDLEGWQEGRGSGMTISGEASNVVAAGNKYSSAHSMQDCAPTKCKAVVAPESETIPSDPYNVTDFRLRVSIQCESDGSIWSHPDCREVDRCIFVTPPSAQIDIQCSH